MAKQTTPPPKPKEGTKGRTPSKPAPVKPIKTK